MRIKHKHRQDIEDNTTGHDSWFAIWPVTLNGETRWLERVYVELVFKVWHDGLPRRWWPLRFTDQPRLDAPNGYYVSGMVAKPIPPRPSFVRGGDE